MTVPEDLDMASGLWVALRSTRRKTQQPWPTPITASLRMAAEQRQWFGSLPAQGWCAHGGSGAHCCISELFVRSLPTGKLVALYKWVCGSVFRIAFMLFGHSELTLPCFVARGSCTYWLEI